MTAQENTPATKPRKGLSDGVCNEFAAFLTVRPGHLQQLKEQLSKRFPTLGRVMQSITTMMPVWQCGHSRSDCPVNTSKRSR